MVRGVWQRKLGPGRVRAGVAAIEARAGRGGSQLGGHAMHVAGASSDSM